MLSTSGIEMMMGILFQQTLLCFITNIGECPTYGFYLGQVFFFKCNVHLLLLL
jgi:hypothetical protein